MCVCTCTCIVPMVRGGQNKACVCAVGGGRCVHIQLNELRTQYTREYHQTHTTTNITTNLAHGEGVKESNNVIVRHPESPLSPLERFAVLSQPSRPHTRIGTEKRKVRGGRRREARSERREAGGGGAEGGEEVSIRCTCCERIGDTDIDRKRHRERYKETTSCQRLPK